jgi:hypothetical protein
VALVLLLRASGEAPATTRAIAIGGIAAAWMGGLPTLNDAYTKDRSTVRDDIDDYQREWYANTGLLSRGLFARWPNHEWVDTGKSAAEHPDQVPVWGGIGLGGYYAGPKVKIVDKFGLSDPLLSRLPVPDGMHEAYFKAGHFARALPDGYFNTVRDGRNEIEHPALSAYYEKLALVTQRPLFDGERLGALLPFIFGHYQSLLTEYAAFQDQKPIDISALPPAHMTNGDDAMKNCPSWFAACAHVGAAFSSHGIRVKLPSVSHAEKIAITVDPGRYGLVFWSHEREVARQSIEAKIVGPLRVVDKAAAEYGFDAVSIVPETSAVASPPATNADGGTLTYFALGD